MRIPLQEIKHVDRSRSATDWLCRRKRYWQYEFAGLGIVPAESAYELFFGSIIHDALAGIATAYQTGGSIDIDLIAMTAYRAIFDALDNNSIDSDDTLYAFEQASLAQGLIRGFYRSVWPTLIAAYPTVIAIEAEVTYEMAANLIFMAKPDLILADLEGDWHYIEYKTTGWKKESWINQWTTAVQLHSTGRAVESTLGKAPIDMTVVGLYKGYEAYGKQTSPFCYAYQKKGNPPFSKDELSYEYKKGFWKTPTWELPGGVKSWVESMPLATLQDNFPRTPPIFIKDELVDSFFRQRHLREMEIEVAISMMDGVDLDTQAVILDTAFEQRWDACSPSIGRACEYRRLCHGARDTDPLKLGYTWREPHHLPELQAQQKVQQQHDLDQIGGDL